MGKSDDKLKSSGALSNAAREKMLIAMAYDVAEQQMLNGTASSQIISHFLRLGSSSEIINRELKGSQRDLNIAKAESAANGQHMDAMYEDAIKAMRQYHGDSDDEDDPDEELY